MILIRHYNYQTMDLGADQVLESLGLGIAYREKGRRVTYLSKHGLCVLAEELLELLVADKVKVLGEEATILQLLLAWL